MKWYHMTAIDLRQIHPYLNGDNHCAKPPFPPLNFKEHISLKNNNFREAMGCLIAGYLFRRHCLVTWGSINSCKIKNRITISRIINLWIPTTPKSIGFIKH